MTPKARIAIGFLLGCAMSTLALFLAGVGHGTYAPMLLNSSVLMFLPGVGFFLALFGTPFLWAAYFGIIPGIRRLRLRVITTFAVLLLHIAPGVWLALTDPAFRRAFDEMRPYLFTYCIVAVVAVWGLVALSRVFGERHGVVAE